MYIKVVDQEEPFGALQVGTVFIYDDVFYIKIQPTCEQHQLKEGGVALIEHNALNLATYEVEWVNDHTLVTKKDSTLVIGAGKGEV